ncbi:MAG: hypothetical protein O2999_01865 [Nitrospirae bacterium]|nr:hypothetical protein [Nitrospirota bacterium]MDA1303047.1 hypothetical protein [Nitrospirota bacterium]
MPADKARLYPNWCFLKRQAANPARPVPNNKMVDGFGITGWPASTVIDLAPPKSKVIGIPKGADKTTLLSVNALVPMANKTARTVWAMMSRKQDFHAV